MSILNYGILVVFLMACKNRDAGSNLRANENSNGVENLVCGKDSKCDNSQICVSLFDHKELEPFASHSVFKDNHSVCLPIYGRSYSLSEIKLLSSDKAKCPDSFGGAISLSPTLKASGQEFAYTSSEVFQWLGYPAVCEASFSMGQGEKAEVYLDQQHPEFAVTFKKSGLLDKSVFRHFSVNQLSSTSAKLGSSSSAAKFFIGDMSDLEVIVTAYPRITPDDTQRIKEALKQ